MKITIINGPNLNLLGTREQSIYGVEHFESYLEKLKNIFSEDSIQYFQSNIEGEIIDTIQQCISHSDAIIINPAAYTHTSIAIADSLRAVALPCVEVHISQIFAREPYRKISYIAEVCNASISGMGLFGYEMAIRYLKSLKGSQE